MTTIFTNVDVDLIGDRHLSPDGIPALDWEPV